MISFDTEWDALLARPTLPNHTSGNLNFTLNFLILHPVL